ncbi:hypothetical protein BU633_11365 [Staphylococcus chromogenes]|nr:hypothetical protein BU633_11365 [Staphylococcus chromogenes]
MVTVRVDPLSTTTTPVGPSLLSSYPAAMMVAKIAALVSAAEVVAGTHAKARAVVASVILSSEMVWL